MTKGTWAIYAQIGYNNLTSYLDGVVGLEYQGYCIRVPNLNNSNDLNIQLVAVDVITSNTTKVLTFYHHRSIRITAGILRAFRIG